MFLYSTYTTCLIHLYIYTSSIYLIFTLIKALESNVVFSTLHKDTLGYRQESNPNLSITRCLALPPQLHPPWFFVGESQQIFFHSPSL